MNTPTISGISLSFSSKYSLRKCPQRLDKDPTRPYLYLSVRIDSNEFMIPFHGNLKTQYSFPLGEKLDPISGKILKTGLNYTKALVITDPKKDVCYPRTIPTLEYKSTNKHEKSNSRL